MANATATALRRAVQLLSSNASMQGVQRVAEVTQTVASGIRRDTPGLLSLAGLIVDAIAIGNTGVSGGLTRKPAESALTSLSIIALKSSGPTEPSEPADTVKRLESTVVGGVQTLGDVACNLTSENGAVELSSLQADGSGITVHCHATSVVTNSVDTSAGAGRRLDECNATTVRRIEYHHLNIYHSASSGLFVVPKNASLTDVEVRQCGKIQDANQVRVSVPFIGTVPLDSSLACVRYDTGIHGWTTEGVTTDGWTQEGNANGVQLTCLSDQGSGVYAAALTSGSHSSTLAEGSTALKGQTSILIAIVVAALSVSLMSLCYIKHARSGLAQESMVTGDKMPIDIETKFGVVSAQLSRSLGAKSITSSGWSFTI